MQNTSLLAMLKPSSIEKLKIEFIEEDDGSGTIQVDWDEKDPDLQWWTDLGPVGQESFILDALHKACSNYVD